MPTLTKARELLAEKNYQAALKLCDSLLTQRGLHADVHTLKALIHQQSGDLEEAGHSMDLALKDNPDHPGTLFTAALINRKLKNWDLAKKQVMKAVREAPDNAQIICQSALFLGGLREPKTALAALEKFTQKNQKHAEAWHLIGKFQRKLGNEEAANFALDKFKALQTKTENNE